MTNATHNAFRTLAIALITLIGASAAATADLERLILREIFPTYPAGIPTDARTFRLYAEFDDDELAVITAGPGPIHPFMINAATHPGASFYQNAAGTFLPPIAGLFPFVPELEYHTYVGIGRLTDEEDITPLSLSIMPTTVIGDWVDISPMDRQGEGILNPSTGKYETFLGQFTATGMAPGASPPGMNDLVDIDSLFDGPFSITMRDTENDAFRAEFETMGGTPDIIEIPGGGGGGLERLILREIFPTYPAGIPADTRTFHLLAEFDDDELSIVLAGATDAGTFSINSALHLGATFYQNIAGGNFPPNSTIIPVVPELEFDTYAAIGLLIDDTDLAPSGAFSFGPSDVNGAWFDTDDSDRQGEGVPNPSSGKYETLLGQFTITGMTPGQSLPDADDLVDPASVFDGSFELLLSDAMLEISKWQFETFSSPPTQPMEEPCEDILNESPPAGTTFNDWIGEAGSPSNPIDLNDPANWSAGAPTTSSQLRLLEAESNVFTALTDDLEVSGMSLRDESRSLNISLQFKQLTISGATDPLSSEVFACDTEFGGSFNFSGGGSAQITAPTAAVTNILVSGAAQFSANALTIGESFSVIEADVSLSDKLTIGSPAFVSIIAKGVVEAAELCHTTSDGDDPSGYNVDFDGRLDINGDCDIEAHPLSSGVTFDVDGFASVDTGATLFDGGGVSQLTLGQFCTWSADTSFTARGLNMMLDASDIIAPQITIDDQSSLTTASIAGLGGDTLLSDGSSLDCELFMTISGDLITSGAGNELRATLFAPSSLRGGSSPRYQISGAAELANATLAIDLHAALTPALGQTFTIVAANSITSPFAGAILPDISGGDPNLGWKINNDPDQIELEVVPFCAGDADYSGAVTAADLATLIGSWGPTTSANEHLDTNGDNNIGAADLATLVGSWGSCP